MKRNQLTHVCVVMVCAIGVLGFGTLASGGTFTVFEDGFENVNPAANTAAYPGSGDYDPNNATVGSWGVAESQPTYVQVSSFYGSNGVVMGGTQPTSAHGGNNYLIGGYHYNITNNWNTPGLPTANFTSDAVVFTLDFWVWGMAGDVGGNTRFQMAGYSGANRAGNGAFLLAAFADAKLCYINSGWVATDLTLNLGQWNHIVADYNFTTPTAPILKLSLNGSEPQEFLALYAGDASVGCASFYGDYTDYYDDIKVVATGDMVTLTTAASPSLVTTVSPVGNHDYPLNATATVTATRYVACPDVYRFDHWTGPVANPTSATTTVLMDAPKSVTAVFVDDRICGDECHAKPTADLDGDCNVDFKDLGLFLVTWLNDTNPY